MADIQLTNATVFPEDAGTGAPTGQDEGDFVSAGHLGTLTLNRASNDFVESGAEFTFNTDNTLLTVSKTLAFIRFEGDIQVQDGNGEYTRTWDYPMMFMVVFPTEDSIPVTAGGVNDVYLWIDRSEEDGAYLRVGQNVATPDGPSVQLGSVDPRDGTTVKTNRGETGGITDADILEAVNADADHGTTASHDYTTSTDLQQGGSDQLNVTGLAGDLADPQNPTAHDHSGDALGASSPLANVTSEILNDSHYATPDDDLQAKLNSLGAGEELVIVGDHVLQGRVTPPDNCIITVEGSVTLAAGVLDHVFYRISPSNIMIRGGGVISGNRSTLPDDGTRNVQSCIYFRESPSDIVVRDIELKDALNAVMVMGGGGASGTLTGNHITVDNVYAHDSGLANTSGDIFYVQCNNVRITNSKFLNCKDTHIAVGNCNRFVVGNNIAFNTATYLNNYGVAAQAIALGSGTNLTSGTIVGNVVGSVGTSTASNQNVIDTFQPNGNVRATISNNYIFGPCNQAIRIEASPESVIANNIVIDPSDDGIFSADSRVIGNYVRGAGNNGINTSNGALIEGNHVVNAAQHGIATFGQTSHVTGNRVGGSGAQGIHVGDGSSSAVVANNIVTGSTNSGINLLANNTKCIISGNRASANAYGIAIGTGTDSNVFVANIIADNTNTGFNGTFGANTQTSVNIT